MEGTSQRAIEVCAPATMGNVAAGFDCLGLALEPLDGQLWGDRVTARWAQADRLTCDGPFADRLPADPGQNLCAVALRLARNLLGRRDGGVALHLHKGLPVGSGLGSSSASAVAAALAALELLDPQRPRVERIAQVLHIAGQTEAAVTGAAHLDNVAPCLLGGMQLLTPLGPRGVSWPDALLVVVASPDFELQTRAARAVLPPVLSLHAAVDFASNLAAALHALERLDLDLLRATLRDVVAEPHRAALVPGFAAAKADALAAGALGCSLSGAGPAIFAACEAPVAAAVSAALAAGFAQSGHQADVRTCRVSPRGALDRITHTDVAATARGT